MPGVARRCRRRRRPPGKRLRARAAARHGRRRRRRLARRRILPADASLAERLIGGVLKAHFAPGSACSPTRKAVTTSSWATSSASSDEARAAAMSALVACCSAALYATPRELSEAPHPLVLATAKTLPLPHLEGALPRAPLGDLLVRSRRLGHPVRRRRAARLALLDAARRRAAPPRAALSPRRRRHAGAPPATAAPSCSSTRAREETLAFVAALGKLLPNAHVVASTFGGVVAAVARVPRPAAVLCSHPGSLNDAFLATLGRLARRPRRPRL